MPGFLVLMNVGEPSLSDLGEKNSTPDVRWSEIRVGHHAIDSTLVQKTVAQDETPGFLCPSGAGRFTLEISILDEVNRL